MKQPLATLSFESLQRRWPGLRRRQVDAIRNEEQLIAVIAASSDDDRATIQRKLREARKETLLSLPLAAISPLNAPRSGAGPATQSQPAM